jgi:hypothetical protein
MKRPLASLVARRSPGQTRGRLAFWLTAALLLFAGVSAGTAERPLDRGVVTARAKAGEAPNAESTVSASGHLLHVSPYALRDALLAERDTDPVEIEDIEEDDDRDEAEALTGGAVIGPTAVLHDSVEVSRCASSSVCSHDARGPPLRS